MPDLRYATAVAGAVPTSPPRSGVAMPRGDGIYRDEPDEQPAPKTTEDGDLEKDTPDVDTGTPTQEPPD